MSLLVRGAGLAFRSAGLALGIVAFFTLVGLAVNWALVIGGVGPLARSQAGGPAAGAGPLSYGFLLVVFGVVLPVCWMLAAQPFAVGIALRRLYHRHRDEMLGVITQRLQGELGGQTGQGAARVQNAIVRLRAHVEEYPRVLQPLLRRALRRARVDDVAAALQGGSGSVTARLAGVIATALEESLAGWSARWLWLVGMANAVAIAAVWILAG